jgi:hypothetical protein
MARSGYRTIWVRCSKCKQDHDERDVEFLNIEEDIQGKDILTFEFPDCKTTQKSYRRG